MLHKYLHPQCSRLEDNLLSASHGPTRFLPENSSPPFEHHLRHRRLPTLLSYVNVLACRIDGLWGDVSEYTHDLYEEEISVIHPYRICLFRKQTLQTWVMERDQNNLLIWCVWSKCPGWVAKDLWSSWHHPDPEAASVLQIEKMVLVNPDRLITSNRCVFYWELLVPWRSTATSTTSRGDQWWTVTTRVNTREHICNQSEYTHRNTQPQPNPHCIC